VRLVMKNFQGDELDLGFETQKGMF